MGRRAMRRRRRRRRRVHRRRVMLAGGLIGLGVHKLTSRDVERVEQHTGVSAEELTDEELDQAVRDLGIEQQQREAADQPQAAAPPPASGGGDYMEELKKLAELRDAGILSDAEFETKKKQILGL